MSPDKHQLSVEIKQGDSVWFWGEKIEKKFLKFKYNSITSEASD